MKVAFVQTYPVYHDLNMTTSQWLALENRDKWMPAILSSLGHEVELWGISHEESEHKYQREGLGSYPIRLFKTTKRHQSDKKDYSDKLVDFARDFDPDLVMLKGVDGGAGLRLLDRYLLPEKKPFVFVIGGKYYNRYVPKAEAVFYETFEQKKFLTDPGFFTLRKSIPEEKLFWLPKSVDTNLFRPRRDIPKEFDVISAGRLVPIKKHNFLGELSNDLNVALIGDGPLRDTLRKKYPALQLLGFVPHRKISEYLNRGRFYFHTGTSEFFPRLIVEAMASGLPVIAFKNVISNDVVPDECGFHVSEDDYVEEVHKMVKADDEHLHGIAKNGRSFVKKNFGLYSSKEPMLNMLKYLQSEREIAVEA